MGTCIGHVGTETDIDMDEDDVMAAQLATLEIFFEQLSIRAATDDE
jgi:hypothetical protein